MMEENQRTDAIQNIVSEDLDVRYGEFDREARSDAVISLSQVVGSTFGPFGCDKLIVDNGGNVSVTNETVTILRNLRLTNPVARIIRDVANSQLFNAGDGTTATVLLVGALLRESEKIVERGVHPTVIIKGYEEATAIAQRQISALATTYDVHDREVCEAVARTALAGTSVSTSNEKIAELVVRAVERVTDGHEVDLNALRVYAKRSHGIQESDLLSGAIIESIPDYRTQWTQRSQCLLLVESDIEPMGGGQGQSATLTSVSDYSSLRKTESAWNQALTKHLKKLEVDCLVCSGSIADTVKSDLREAGIQYHSAVNGPDFSFLRRVLGANAVPKVEEASSDDLQTVDIEYDWEDEETTVMAKTPNGITIRLQAASSNQLEELESATNDAIEVVAQVASDGRVIPGGGAPEAAIAAAVRDEAPAVDGRDQLALLAFANAIETLPRTLAQNAGLDGVEVLLRFRTALHEGYSGHGLDLRTGELTPMEEAGILETVAVKTEMLSNALQATRLILRIDGVIEEPEASPS